MLRRSMEIDSSYFFQARHNKLPPNVKRYLLTRDPKDRRISGEKPVQFK